MDNKRFVLSILLTCSVFCVILCLLGWLKLNAERENRSLVAQATQTQIDNLTARYGEELSQLIADYEYGRRKTPKTSNLTITVTHLYVLEYTETRCQAYAAVAIDSENIYNPLDSRPCGFCAVYVFVRADSQQPWEFVTFLPIMGSASDHARDWNAHQEQFEGLIGVRPQWEACPYYGCGVK